MKNSKLKNVARLLVTGACFLTAATQGAEFWLRTGVVTNTMPDGRQVAMWAFARDTAAGASNGVLSVPGPQLNVAAGDNVIIHVQNWLPEPVSLIIPGQYGFDSLDPVFQSGGPYDGRVRSWTREAAPGGGTADFKWSNVTSGTCLYHSGSHASVQVQMGLYGALAVTMPGPQAYTAVPFDSAVTLLLSEIDPEVHDAVAAGVFGPGPGFFPSDFTDASAAALEALITGSTDPFAQFIAAQFVSSPTAGGLVADLMAIVGGPCIYDPFLLPDSVLSPATLALLQQNPPPSQNYPISGAPFNGYLVRLNRLLLQDGFAAAGITGLPLVKNMTSTIRSYAQYFLVNGKPYTNGIPAIAAGAPGSRILLRFLNAGMDAHVPTLNNGGDLQLLSEDGQQLPYSRMSSVLWLPALKTVDAIWSPTAVGTYAIYDRRLGLVNALQSPGGMTALLSVSGTAGALTPPVILIQPASQTVSEFSTATFTVVASGSGLTYQWRSNAVPITGATSAALSLPNVTIAAYNGAVFSVVVSGTGGPAVTSANATLTVVAAAPTITSQPASHSITPPAATSFSVAATGSAPLTYVWQKGATATGPFANLANGPHISGATSTTLNILSPTTGSDAGFYQVVVTGPGGVATSIPAELRVAPSIVTQPASTVVLDLHTATFTVVASGSSLSYQWQRLQSGVTYTNIPGATSASYSFIAQYLYDNNAVFRVVVTGSGGPSVTSSTATLTVTPVNSAPVISSQPTSIITNSGVSSVSFSVVAYGYPAVTYQWQRFVSGNWVSLVNSAGFSGVTTPTLLISNRTGGISITNASNYRVRIANSVTPAGVFSTAASLTVIQSFAGTGAVLPASGTAFPYPENTSANIPAFIGASVKHATVILTSLTDTEPNDLSVLLVTAGTSATRRKVEFMAGVAVPPAATAVEGVFFTYPVANATLVFDDGAASQISTIYPLASGTYQPTVTTPVASFPAPAPGVPYATTLSSLNGFVQTSAARWSLYVNATPADAVPVTGGLLASWSVTLTVGP